MHTRRRITRRAHIHRIGLSDPCPSEALRNGLNGRFLTGPNLSDLGNFGPLHLRHLGKTQRFISSRVRNSAIPCGNSLRVACQQPELNRTARGAVVL